MSDSKTTLRGFYPHLQGAVAPKSNAHLCESIIAKMTDSRVTQQQFITDNQSLLIAIARDLAECFNKGGKLICLGNGGSACDAAHLAVEFSHPVTAGRPALPAVNLGADTAMLTALANDVGFDKVFSRQISNLAGANDAVFCLSTSGNAKNIVEAMRVAGKHRLLRIALLGGSGGVVADERLAEHLLCVPSQSVHRIQECHVLSYHILWDLVHSVLAEVNSGGGDD